MSAVLLIGLTWTGCRGIPTRNEQAAREHLAAVRAKYRPADERGRLPVLDAQATLETLLTYAVLNHPSVEAAYFDYVAAVERITLERSLPDPRLTLELDIQDVVMTVMPGLMSDLPWVRKLRLRADVATAESAAKYEAFAQQLLQAAYDVKRPYFQLHFLDSRLAINRKTLALMGELEQIARAQNEIGKVTLQDVLRAQIEQERLRTEISNLEDSRNPLRTQLRGALGLHPQDPDPPIPDNFVTTPIDLTSDQLLATALERNPRLRQMEAEVRLAESGIQLAHQSRLPDYNVGVEADVKRPQSCGVPRWESRSPSGGTKSPPKSPPPRPRSGPPKPAFRPSKFAWPSNLPTRRSCTAKRRGICDS